MARFVLALACVLLVAAILVASFDLEDGRSFPWGTHLVTVPAVLLLGVIVGWWMRERQAAEDRAREEIDREA